MWHLFHRRKPAGFSLVELLVVIGVIAVLAGMLVKGAYWLRCRAEEADVVNRAENLGYALRLYHLEHRKYPSAYPADLGTRLAPYLERELGDCVDTPEAFASPAHPSEGAEPLNRAYVPPARRMNQNAYVLAVQPKRTHARTAVLFSNNVVELVETLAVNYSGSELAPGSVVQGGVVTFATGTSIELASNTMMRMIRSFSTENGSVFHIIKVPRYKPGFLRADVVGADLVQVVTGAGVVSIRNGVADLDVVPVELAEAPETVTEEDTGDDPLACTQPVTEDDTNEGGSSLGDFALFSNTGLQCGGNSSVDHLIGSNGNVELGAECDTRSIIGAGSLTSGANLAATGNVVFNGPLTLTGNTEISGDVQSSGAVVLDGASVGGNLSTTEGVSLKNATVRGDLVSGAGLQVGANGSAQGSVTVDGDLMMTSNARIYGDTEYTGSLDAKPKQLVGEASQTDSVEISVDEYTPFELPPATQFTTGSQDVDVSDNSALELPPGEYGHLILGGGSEITFSEGAYSFLSITAQGNTSITLDVGQGGSGVEIFVAGDVSLGGTVQSQISGAGSAADVYLETGGDFTIAGNTNWHGTVYAPSGGVSLGGNSTMYGACYASGPVELGHHSKVFFTRSVREIGDPGGGTTGESNSESDDGDGSGGSGDDGNSDAADNSLMNTYLRIANHSAEVTVDSRIVGSGSGIGHIPRRQSPEAGKSNGRNLTRGVSVPVGRWAEANGSR